ncbi:putative Fe-S center protein [Planomicrobium stackebrandtii]|uniref:Fe-S center protein n=1 Tax=Planomicrobium stackebrandtii TaxID=253160 RepID=A0ABU0GU83_9BACL|nr:YwpF family protein [Planomicrobium stackebrandtii]MDQ0428331.1 putative Fe-S center protein [Planomicrobium stackebrandtii]
MKTFKMLSLGVEQDDQVVDYPVHDGIIINQENTERSWILEMLIDLSHQEMFEKLKQTEEVVAVQVVISYPGNEPAPFEVVVHAVKAMGDHISVLMKGTLKRARRKYAETLLSELLEDGFEGQELLERFETDMRTRPGLRKDEAKS